MKVKKLKNNSWAESIYNGLDKLNKKVKCHQKKQIDDAYQRGFEAGIEFQKEQELNKKFPPEKIISQKKLDTWGLAD